MLPCRFHGGGRIHDALHDDLALKEQLQRRLEEATGQSGGIAHRMANGDYFATLPLTAKNMRDGLAGKIAAAALPPSASEDDRSKLIHLYELPGDYAPARERANHYIEAARAAAQIGSANPAPERALQSDSVRGPLTPWALDQIVRLFADIDIRRYVRSQNIYQGDGARWTVIGAEYFVSADDLKRERFPRLDIHNPERLFMELCAALDRRLMHQLADAPESLALGALFLNIAVESVLDSPFANFVRSVPAARRGQITFELNRGDLLLNLATTLNAIAILRQEGFRVALDALHPQLLLYLDPGKFAADYYKIRVSKDILEQLDNADVLRAMQSLPVDKIIFYRCDNEGALAIGRKLGVTMFQGWLIDDAAQAH